MNWELLISPSGATVVICITPHSPDDTLISATLPPIQI